MAKARSDKTPQTSPALDAQSATVARVKRDLAHQIVRLLAERELTLRAAAPVTGATAADLSRISNDNLDRFSVDRLLAILSRLGHDVRLDVHAQQRTRDT